MFFLIGLNDIGLIFEWCSVSWISRQSDCKGEKLLSLMVRVLAYLSASRIKKTGRNSGAKNLAVVFLERASVFSLTSSQAC